MITWQENTKIYLHRDPVDFRKQINGLALVVEELMALREQAQYKIDSLAERILALLQKQFSPSSEKASPNQLGLFAEAEVEVDGDEESWQEGAKEKSVKSHTRKTKPRVSIHDNLTREDIIYDISDDENSALTMALH